MKENYDVIEKAYVEYYDLFYKTAYSRMKNEMDTEDAVQGAFELALKYSHSYKPKRATCQTWINNILQNRCTDLLALERRRGMTIELDEELLDGVDLDADGGIVMRKIIADIAKEKNPDTRAILHLHFVDRAQRKDIAEVTNIKVRVISNLLDIFKRNMRKKYAL